MKKKSYDQLIHDLRSPLTCLELAIGQLQENPRKYQKLAEESLRKINNLINGIESRVAPKYPAQFVHLWIKSNLFEEYKFTNDPFLMASFDEEKLFYFLSKLPLEKISDIKISQEDDIIIHLKGINASQNIKELSFEIEDRGMEVVLKLPQCPLPPWVSQSLNIKNETLIIIDENWDDYKSFHGIEKRFFTHPHKYLEENIYHENHIFLVSSEFRTIEESGMDFLEDLDEEGKSFIVTPNYKDPLLQSYSQISSIPLIPRELLPFVKIQS